MPGKNREIQFSQSDLLPRARRETEFIYALSFDLPKFQLKLLCLAVYCIRRCICITIKYSANIIVLSRMNKLLKFLELTMLLFI